MCVRVSKGWSGRVASGVADELASCAMNTGIHRAAAVSVCERVAQLLQVSRVMNESSSLGTCAARARLVTQSSSWILCVGKKETAGLETQFYLFRGERERERE